VRHFVLLNELTRPKVFSTTQGWGMAIYSCAAPGKLALI
jgi:hypothetical protein